MFVLERGLGTMLLSDAFANAPPAGEAPRAEIDGKVPSIYGPSADEPWM